MAAAYNAVTVTSTATTILNANNGRRGFIISNNSGTIIYIGFDSNVLATTGIQILPQDKWESSGEHAVYKGSVWGITASSTADVRYWDWTP